MIDMNKSLNRFGNREERKQIMFRGMLTIKKDDLEVKEKEKEEDENIEPIQERD